MKSLMVALVCFLGVAQGGTWKRFPSPPSSDFQVLPAEGFGGVLVQSATGIKGLLEGESQWRHIAPTGTKAVGNKLFDLSVCSDLKILDLVHGKTNRMYGVFDSVFQRDCWDLSIIKNSGAWVGYGIVSRRGVALSGKDTILPDGSGSIVWRLLSDGYVSNSMVFGVNKNQIYAIYKWNGGYHRFANGELIASSDTGVTWVSLGIKSSGFVAHGDTLVSWYYYDRNAMVSVDGGATWDSLSYAGVLGVSNISMVGGNLYGWRNERFVVSTDLGRNWSPLNQFEFAPVFSGKKYYAKSGATLVSSDDGKSDWRPVGFGYASSRVSKLDLFYSGLIAMDGNEPESFWIWNGVAWSEFSSTDSALDIAEANGDLFALGPREDELYKYDRVRKSWNLDLRATNGLKFRGPIVSGDFHLAVSTEREIYWIEVGEGWAWQRASLPEVPHEPGAPSGLVGYLAEGVFDWIPVCVMGGVAYGLQEGEWRVLSDAPSNVEQVLPVPSSDPSIGVDPSKQGAYLVRREGGAKLISGLWRDSVDLGENAGMCRYRDSVLAWGSNGVFVGSGRGIRKMRDDELPAKPRIATWARIRVNPGVWTGATEGTIVLQDILGDIWYQDASGLAGVKNHSSAKPAFKVHGQTLTMELVAPSRVRVERIDMNGRRTEIVAETNMSTGVRSVFLPKASGVHVLRVTIDGLSNSRIVAPGGGHD